MAAFLTWLNQWQIEIDWVDEDHREIAAILNRLADVNRRAFIHDGAAAKREVVAVFDALIERARCHFLAEEALLREIRFPEYDEHRREQAMQLAEFTDLRRGLEQGGVTGLSADALDGFKRWFFNHVVVEDRGYADYYYGETVAAATAPHPALRMGARVWAAPVRDLID